MFGSMISRAALPFMAVLVLNAKPGQMAVLRLSEIVPAFLIGLVAGVWVDRLRRRPVLIAADLGRAVLLGTIPVVAFTAHVRIEQLYLVAIGASALTVFFDVADQSFLPALVAGPQLLDANSKLAATASIAEVGGFGIAGWLVQLFTAPVAIAIDAVSFVVSAVFVASIRTEEQPVSRAEPVSAWREMIDGISALVADRSLLTIAVSAALMEASFGIVGTIYALYALRELGFAPGLLGLVFAVGGVSSLVAAMLARRVNRRFGMGPSMIGGLVLAGIGVILLPLARGAGLGALLLLVAQQLIGDGGATLFEIDQTSLRQSIAPPHMLGRINAGTRFVALGATLVGAVLGGILGQTAGYRATLIVGALAMFAAALVVLGSPIRHR
jgi:MFS family permease